MRKLLLAAVVFLAACASPVPVAQLSPSPAPSAVDTSPAPPGKPAPNLDGLGCRLPVTWAASTGTNTAVSKAGFLHFPDLTLTEDSAAPVTSRFFNRASMSWLSVSRNAVSPDGSHYAYGEGNPYIGTSGRLHVVNVTTRVDRVVYAGPIVYGVVDYASEGIYITKAGAEGPSLGLWLMNPANGATRVINATVSGPTVGGGAAWTQDFDASDPSPAPGGMVGPANRIERVDLSTGRLVPWFYEAGVDMRVVGFDASGHPFVSASRYAGGGVNDSVELWVLSSRIASSELFVGERNKVWPAQVAAIDAHGVWFDAGNADSVWLYTPDGPMQMVAKLNVTDMQVAGGCIA